METKHTGVEAESPVSASSDGKGGQCPGLQGLAGVLYAVCVCNLAFSTEASAGPALFKAKAHAILPQSPLMQLTKHSHKSCMASRAVSAP